MLRHIARRRLHAAGARMMSAGSRGPSEATAAKSNAPLMKFLMAAIPIGVIAAVFERASQGQAPRTQSAASEGSSSGTADASSGQGGGQPRASIHGGTTSGGVDIDPANPLHKMLPETDCEFCLETREKLWGMMKGMKKLPASGDGGGAAKKAGESAAAGAGAGSAAGPSLS